MFTFAGCGDPGSTTDHDTSAPTEGTPALPTSIEPRDDVSPLGRLAARIRSAEHIRPADRTIEEAMPNVCYLVDGEERRVSDLYVVGQVEGVRAGGSFAWEFTDERETRIDLAFNDERAMISTIFVTMDVEHGIAADPAAEIPAFVEFGLSIPSPVDLEWAQSELIDLGRIVVILEAGSVMWDEPGLYNVLEDGAFFGPVAADDTVTFPMLSPSDQELLAPSPLTLAELEEPPKEPIPLERDQG